MMLKETLKQLENMTKALLTMLCINSAFFRGHIHFSMWTKIAVEKAVQTNNTQITHWKCASVVCMSVFLLHLFVEKYAKRVYTHKTNKF